MTDIIAVSVADRASGVFHLCLETAFAPDALAGFLVAAQRRTSGRFNAGRYVASLASVLIAAAVPVRLIADWRTVPDLGWRALVTSRASQLHVVLLKITPGEAEPELLFEGLVEALLIARAS